MDIGPEQNGTWNSYMHLLSPSCCWHCTEGPGLWLGWVGQSDTHLFCDARNPRLMAAWAARARLNNSLAVSLHLGSGRDYPHEMAASSHPHQESRHHQEIICHYTSCSSVWWTFWKYRCIYLYLKCLPGPLYYACLSVTFSQPQVSLARQFKKLKVITSIWINQDHRRNTKMSFWIWIIREAQFRWNILFRQRLLTIPTVESEARMSEWHYKLYNLPPSPSPLLPTCRMQSSGH